LKPILPEFAVKVEKCLAIAPQKWRNVQDAMEPHTIHPFEHLVQRLEKKAIGTMIEDSKEGAPPAVVAQTTAMSRGVPSVEKEIKNGVGQKSEIKHPDNEPLAAQINIDQFLAVDLRVGRVLTAEAVAKSDKLLKLTLDAGHLGQRTILAGIQKAYAPPEKLVGRLVVFCANLAPRTMGKFGTSEGMICAAGPGGSEVFVLSPDSGAQPGQRIH